MTRGYQIVVFIGLLVAAGCSSRQPVDLIRQDGDRHFDKHEYDPASEAYSAIIDRYPGDWRAQQRYGECQLLLDQPAEARRALEVANTIRPGNDAIIDALAEALYRLEEHDQLFALLQGEVSADRSVNDYLRLASFAHRTGDPDTAAVAYETALRLNDRQSVDPYLAAAAFQRDVGDLDAAVRTLTIANEIDPFDEGVRTMLLSLGEVPGPTLARPEDRLP